MIFYFCGLFLLNLQNKPQKLTIKYLYYCYIDLCVLELKKSFQKFLFSYLNVLSFFFLVSKKKTKKLFETEEEERRFRHNADWVLRRSVYRNDNRLTINMERFKYLDYDPKQRTPSILIPYLEILEPKHKRVWGNWKKYSPRDPRFWNQSGHTQPDLGLDPCLDIWGVSPEKGTPITKQMLDSYNPNYWGDMLKFKTQHGISWHKFKYESRINFYMAFPDQHPEDRTLSAG